MYNHSFSVSLYRNVQLYDLTPICAGMSGLILFPRLRVRLLS